MTLTCRLLALVALFPSACSAAPNVVMILADDLGWVDVGCYGSTYHRTPHIDALAERGLRFTNSYSASAFCSPTRASILTGLYPARTGLTMPYGHVERVQLEKRIREPDAKRRVTGADPVTRLDTGYFTLGEAFREAGYRTAHFGKWHLGPEPHSALQHGFEVDLPHMTEYGPTGENGYFAPWEWWPDAGEPGEHIEDRMADEAIRWIEEHADEPFLLHYWAFSVHWPWMAKPEYVLEAETRIDPEAPQRNPVYSAMVRSLDDAVGRLAETLDRLGLAENTILIFVSDNGAFDGKPKGHKWQDRPHDDAPVSSNAPLRSGKGSIYEGGSRVPMIVVWPGEAPAGAETDALFHSADFYPTLVHACGIPTPYHRLDGVSQLATLRGEPSPRTEIYRHFPHTTWPHVEGCEAATSVRRGDWKLIRFHALDEAGADRLELYNLADDPGESENLSDERADLVGELGAAIEGYLVDTEAVIPVFNPDHAPED